MKFVLKVKTGSVTRSHVIEARSEEHAKQKISSMYLKSEIVSINSQEKTSGTTQNKTSGPINSSVPHFLLKK